jgi:predicted ATP-grasp superfamily ATP-dependent carboligase
MKVLVAGSSARAVAYSALRAGHEPVAFDSFGDSDLLRIADWRRLDKNCPISSAALEMGADAAVFASGVENRPEIIDELARAGVKVLAPSSDSVRRCRDLDELARFCAENEIDRPAVFESAKDADAGADYLVKRRKSGAGIGVRRWRGESLACGEYLQEAVAGVPLSAVFFADGKYSSLCGISRQLAGESSLGASGFSWCGNIMPFSAPPGERGKILSEARRIAAAITSRFGLAGAIGADFIYGGGKLRLLEINPRISASFELVETLRGVSAFGLHVEALAGTPPPEPPGLMSAPFAGKGIVYAPRDLSAPDTREWYNLSRRDVPNPGSPLPAGLPICTVVTPKMESESHVVEYLASEAKKIWKECGLTE